MPIESFASLSRLLQEQLASGRPYLEFLRVRSMSCGLYVLAAGAIDGQKPHAEDEIYYVVRGVARMMIRTGDGKMDDRAVTAGDVIFVQAGQEHRFHSISEELAALVVFAPAERA